MDLAEIYANLCTRDPRYPLFDDIYGDDPPEDVPAPRTECACDNCFYGRDALALEILRLRGDSDD